MAKQRPKSTSTTKAGRSTSARAAAAASNASPSTQPLTSTSAPTGPQRRTTYIEAVAVYEKGLEALQRHDYSRAVELLESVLKLYPDEKELHERVRLYLNICAKHVAPQPSDPQTVDERLFASTLAINGGRYDEAISHLRLVRDEDPDNDYALYMLAVAHAGRGEHAEAIAHLERSIALNPENRALARRDPDLEVLREDEAFRAALEAAPRSGPPPARPVNDRRRPVRTRSGR